MMPAQRPTVYQQGSEATALDQRLSELQSQIDQLSSSLRAWFQSHERAVEHEWSALRQIHEEPARELREQAASLTDVCLAAATAGQRGLERAEARLSLLESDLHRGMRELSRDVQAAVTELRSRLDRQPASIGDGASPWPLEGVMRLHGQLRRAGDASGAALARQSSGEPVAVSTAVVDQPTDGVRALSDRINSLEHAIADGQTEIKAAADRSDRSGRNWLVLLPIGMAFIVGGGALVWRLERQVGAAATRVTRAEQQAQIATETASKQLSAVREDAAHEIAAARETALKAQTISDVLAAPDLVRFNLIGGTESTRFSAQALWSRSRGFVFSGSRLPPPPAGSTYQIWLSTAVRPVSAGIFTPDASGRITLATDSPPRVPRPVLGVVVTIEPAGGGETPGGATLLARATPPPTP